MLNHVDSASSAASAGAAIGHSNIASSAVGAISGAAALTVGSTTPSEAMEAGYWFLHAQVWIFTPQQILQILGTLCTLICTANIIYQFLKSIKSKPKKAKLTNSGPVIQGGSGSGHPKIDPK